jgi:hypothetical protein
VSEEFLAVVAAGDGTGAPPGDSSGGRDPLAWYGDSAYGTGDLRDAIEKAGHQAVIKPKPVQTPVQGGFTIDDFTVHEEQGTITCPAGVTRPIPPARHVVSPTSPPGAGAGSSSATGAPPRTTPGSSAAPPRSTCAT